ncbi:MAG: RDD family protein [Ahniella sp.]|nr:RDD family protein [Ahniella sp.]
MTELDAFLVRAQDAIPAPMRKSLPLVMDVRSQCADRVAQGQTEQEAILGFGPPETLAAAYLQEIPLALPDHGRRLIAKFIDLAAVLIGVALPFWIVFVAVDPDTQGLVLVAALLAAVLMVPLYTVYAEFATAQTLGKKWMRLMVVRDDGTRISLLQALGRQLPFVMQMIWVDAAFALFTAHRQCAAEVLTRTRVVSIESTVHPAANR